MSNRRLIVMMLAVGVWAGVARAQEAAGPSGAGITRPPEAKPVDPDAVASVKVKLRGVDETVHIVRSTDQGLMYRLNTDEGESYLTPGQFTQRVFAEQANRSWFLVALNVTDYAGVVWVALGLVGQALFAGRLIVQWLASEKSKRSVVPPAFWWMALGGASILLVYFIWRRDIVGIIGQCTGWTIYVRNLYFIYWRGHEEQAVVDAKVECDEPRAANS